MVNAQTILHTQKMKSLFLSILIIFFYSCSDVKQVVKEDSTNSFYIDKIDSNNDWSFIYTNRNDSVFLIVSKRAEIINPNWEEIKVGNYYNLNLTSIIPVINGTKLFPINYLDFEGISLDEKTTVNINPEMGIYDIYSSKNLKGLYLVQ